MKGKNWSISGFGPGMVGRAEEALGPCKEQI